MQQNTQTSQNYYRTLRSKLSHMDNLAGRYVFGDDNHFTRHVRSYFISNAIKAKTKYRPSAAPVLFERKDLQEQGYMPLNDLYAPELIATISKKIAKAFATEGRYVATTENNYSQSLVKPFEDVPEIKELITPGIIASMENYYQCHIGLGTVDVRRNFPLDDKAPAGVYSSDWHTDKRMPVMLKLFYLVNDTTEKDGPFHIIDRKRTGEIIRHEFKSRQEPGASVEDRQNVVKFIGKAGSVMIANTTRCLHKAGQPEQGRFRDLIQFQFFPSETPLPANWSDDPSVSRRGLGKEWQ